MARNGWVLMTPLGNIPIVDGHLDLAENVTLFGRDLTRELPEIRAQKDRIKNQATVSLPELRRGGIAVAFATVTPGFLVEDVGDDFEPRSALYRTAEEAQANALKQIDLYESWHREERIRLIKTVHDLENHLLKWRQDQITGLVLLMEGADPIVHVSDLSIWWDRGLRMIGLTYGDTRYGAGVAGGRPISEQAGLTKAGVELLQAMAGIGFIWDISHLTEKAMWQGFALNHPAVCASHANAQSLTPTSRHLSDKVIQALAERNGVIGLVLYNRFLDPEWSRNKEITVTLEINLRRHAEHIANLVGWDYVAIGSDLDGGFGRFESPMEINSIADLHKIGRVVPEEARKAVLSTNWLNFLRRSLPRQT
jgi:membrane dipeptidase